MGVIILDKKKKKKKHGNRFYWRCELKTQCNGRIITELVNGEHVLAKKTKSHIHAPDICRGDVIDARATIISGTTSKGRTAGVELDDHHCQAATIK